MSDIVDQLLDSAERSRRSECRTQAERDSNAAAEILGLRKALRANHELRVEIERLRAPLSPTEMRLVDKHCDWVAFGHAWNAVMKARKALEGK